MCIRRAGEFLCNPSRRKSMRNGSRSRKLAQVAQLVIAPMISRGLDELLARGGGEYFADNRLTLADLKAFVLMRWLGSGMLDFVPTDLVQRLAPSLVEHQERIECESRVTAYYATRA